MIYENAKKKMVERNEQTRNGKKNVSEDASVK